MMLGRRLGKFMGWEILYNNIKKNSFWIYRIRNGNVGNENWNNILHK